MSKLYIQEFGGVDISGLPSGPPVANQTPVTIGSAANSSVAFNDLTHAVRLHTDVVCSYTVVGDATANHPRMAANSTEYVKVTPGGKVSVIANT
jgi:hypothetical protein